LVRGSAGPARELRIRVFEITNPRRAGGLSYNAAGIRSSSALRNACVSWAVEFGGARRAEPEEGPQGPDAADNRLLGVGRAPPCLGTKYL